MTRLPASREDAIFGTISAGVRNAVENNEPHSFTYGSFIHSLTFDQHTLNVSYVTRGIRNGSSPRGGHTL